MLAEFIDKSLVTDDPGDLFDLYLDTLGNYGIDRVMYSALRNTGLDETKTPGISYNYPSHWVDYYMSNGYVHLDPVRKHATGVRRGFSWEKMMRVRDMSWEEELLMHQGQEAGLHNGLGIPFHGPFGEVYGVGLACSQKVPDVGKFLREIEMLSVQFHTAFSSLHDASRSAEGTQLTPRELEVLKWCARGKSNWTIGEILNISEHGVDFHMRNILRKFNADSRITVVVKAIHAGVISL